MAKKKQEEETALTTTDDAFDDLFDGFSEEEIADIQEMTGLEETEDFRRPPFIGWNQDFTDDDGTDIRPNVFYNFQTRQAKAKIDCAIIYVKKFREYATRDEQNNKIVVCRSWDMKEGQWMGEDQDDETEVQYRVCEKCPFRKGKKGKRKDCTVVSKVIAYDLDDDEWFVFHAQRSSAVPFSDYLERSFFKKLKRGGKRFDIPSYMMVTRLQLKEVSARGKRYYELSPELVGKVKDKDKVIAFKELAKEISTFSKDQFEEAGDKNPPPAKDEDLDDDVSDDDVPF